MKSVAHTTLLAKPRWDGSRVLFEIEADGACVPCAISRAALDDLGGRGAYKPADMIRRFMSFQDRIEKIAADIFRARPASVTGTVSVWADDIDEPQASPAIASQRPQSTTAALG